MQQRILGFSSLLILLAISLASPAFSQIEQAMKWRDVPPNTANLRVGDVITFTFEATIDKGYHVYSAKQPADAVLPAIFELDKTAKGVALVGGLQEAGDRHVIHDDVFDADIAQYEGKVTFRQQVKITAPEAKIDGVLSYQVCDDSRCIPGTHEISISIKAKPGTEAAEAQAADAEATATPNTDPVKAETPAAATVAAAPANTVAAVQEEPSGCGINLWALFLQSLLLGLAAVFTPCVFPMVPLTVSIFTKKGSPTRAQGIRNALTYALSIISIYTLLGILLAAIFGPDVLRDIANNPWFNLFFFALLIFFGMSFLGWFELTLPASWSTSLTMKGNRGGFAGTFFLALALAVVSFACTGPLVATALLGAASGDCFSSPIIAMLGFSTGLAFPFGFLAFAPGLLSNLPKSGGWLNTVKVVLGFLEIAFALTYLSGADLVMHWGLLDRGTFVAIWMVLFAFTGLNLIGKLLMPHDDELERVSVPRLILASMSFVFVLYLLPGLLGARLPLINGFLPPVNKNMLMAGGFGGGQPASASEAEICDFPNKKYAEIAEHTPPGFCAFYDLEQGLAYAKAHNKRVFLDFTGFNCKNCRYVEGLSWPEPAIKKMLTNDYVMISLFTDDAKKLDEMQVLPDGTKLRTRGNVWLQYQKAKVNQNSSPYYVLMDADQKVYGEMGYDGSGDAFTAKLQALLEAGLK